MSDYFDEFKLGLDNAYKVVQTVWKLFEGQTSQSQPQLVLDPAIPAGPFRIAVTISAGPGPPHNTFEGIITIGNEILEFSEATRKTTYQVYKALPKVVIEGLDCPCHHRVHNSYRGSYLQRGPRAYRDHMLPEDSPQEGRQWIWIHPD